MRSAVSTNEQHYRSRTCRAQVSIGSVRYPASTPARWAWSYPRKTWQGPIALTIILRYGSSVSSHRDWTSPHAEPVSSRPQQSAPRGLQQSERFAAARRHSVGGKCR